MDSLLLVGLVIGLVMLLTVWGLYVARRPRGYPDTPGLQRPPRA
jgi:hypothetical protein